MIGDFASQMHVNDELVSDNGTPFPETCSTGSPRTSARFGDPNSESPSCYCNIQDCIRCNLVRYIASQASVLVWF